MKPMKTLSLLLLALAVGAQAQDDSDTGWHSSVGAKIGVAPRYLGSDKSHIAVAPDFTFTDGTFFADSERGLGAQYQNGDGFTASAALNYDLGRTEKNSIYRPGSKELKGMGRVKGSALDSRRRRKRPLRRAETPRPGFPLGRQLNPADGRQRPTHPQR